MTKTRDSKGQYIKRRQRVPFGGHRTKLQLSADDQKAFADDGYVARWFNDTDGRVQQAEAGWYEFVTPDEAQSIGGGSIGEGNSDLNGKVSKIVSKGGGEPVRAFLMKIKKEYYDEDQLTKEERNSAIDSALRSGKPGGNVVENQYVPKGHTQQI